MMLTTGELTSMSAEQVKLMPEKSVQILRPTQVKDNRGGSVDNFVVVATTVGRISHSGRAGYNERERTSTGNRFHGEDQYLATLPAGTSVKVGDRLRIPSGTFDVTDSSEPQSFDTAIRCLVRRVD